MLRKILYWLKKSDYKACRGYCPRCAFFDECYSEVKYLEKHG